MDTIKVSRQNILDLIEDMQEGIDYAGKCEVHDFLTPVPEGKVTYPGAVGRLKAKIEMQIMRLNWMLEDDGVF